METKVSGSDAPVVGKNRLEDIPTRQKVNVLWTGGFDSTFRMIQLSKIDVDIQPYYVCHRRRSEALELKAISKITADIVNHPETLCTLLPLIKFNASDLAPDESVTEAYQRLNEKYSIGSQFDWLARFANLFPGAEMCSEKSHARGYICLIEKGNMVKVSEGKLSYLVVDKKGSHPDVYKIFGNYHFPYPLIETTKMEMVELYKQMGFEHTMSTTWFCHTPINNKPCGACSPCKAVIEEGLTFRMPNSAIKKYERLKKYGEHSLYGWFYKLHLKMGQIKANGFSFPNFLRVHKAK